MSSDHTDVSKITRKLGVTFNDFGLGLENGDSELENEETLPKPQDHPMDRKEPKYGDCHIFNYQEFEDDRNNRPGSEMDAARLKHDFTELNFNVHDIHENLSKRKTLDVLKEAAKKDYEQSKCFICCFLTHGKEGNLLMSNDKYLRINDILKLFSRASCESLAGKPKIFIFQACRGCSCEEGVPCDSTDGGSVIDFPDYLDFLLVYSTYEGEYAFKTRDKYFEVNNHGSYFIDELCRTLEQFSDKLDLLQILTIVNYRVAHFFLSNTDDEETDQKKQMPCFTSRLTTEVKFNKKISRKIVSSETRFFDVRRNLSRLGRDSIKYPLEDKKVYGVRNSAKIKFLFLLNVNSNLEGHLSSLKTSLNRSNFQTEEKKDWKREELRDFLKEVAARNLSDTDCLICFVACQGKGDYMYDKNGKKFLKRKIVEEFSGKVCKDLRGKPKIFIFLMLSPTKPWWPYAYADDTDSNGNNMIPVHSDILEVAIGIQEFRQLKCVIEKICNILGKESSEDFLSQLTRMNDELVKNYGFYSPPKDSPTPLYTLKRFLYFSSLQKIFEFYFSSDDNLATFCFKSTLTKTLILNKPIC